jgi:hypothetical protein
MKRLTVFGAIFGCGLLLLVLLLGPARLYRPNESTEIGTSDLRDLSPTVRVEDPGKGGRPIGIVPQGAGTIPHWIDRPSSPGVVERVKEWEFSFAAIEAFPGGFHFTSPHLAVFPALKLDEKPATVVEARGSDVAMRGSAAGALDFGEKPRVEDVKAFTLAPAAVVRTFTPDGEVESTLTTDRLEAPEAQLPADGKAVLAPVLVAPGELRMVRADGSFDLRAGGMVLHRLDGRLELRPPLSITTTGLDLADPTAGPAAPNSAPKPAPDVVAQNRRETTPRAPITITADGPATYVRKAGPDATATDAAFQPLLGPGELVFTGRVSLTQGDRSLSTDRLRLVISRTPDGSLEIEEMEAGVAGSPLELGLLAGRGKAAFARFRRLDGGLELDGPIEFDDLVIGEGAAARRVELRSRRRAQMRQLPADSVLPERVLLVLEEEAHLEVAGELVADADVIELLLRAPGNAADGTARPAELIEARLIATRPGSAARAELANQGRAFARRIRLTEGADGRLVVLTGDARAEFPQGFVAAPDIDLHVPAVTAAAGAGAFTLQVAQLVAAEFDLPAGAAPFEPAAAPTASGGATVAAPLPPRRLVIDPLEPCRLMRTNDRTEFTGRARYRIHEVAAGADSADFGNRPLAPDPLQELATDHLVLDVDRDAGDESRLSATATGRVELSDAARGLSVAADRLRTDTRVGDSGSARWLVVEGAPAQVSLPLREGAETAVAIRAPRLELDLGRGALDAFGGAARTRLTLPEEVLQQFLSAPTATEGLGDATAGALADGAANDAAATGGTIELECADFHFAPDPASGDASRGSLRFEGGMVARRASDGAIAKAARARFDLARGEGQLDGTEAEPVLLLRPRPYAPDRVESLAAAWVKLEKRGERIRCADDAVVVLHPEEPPTAERPLPDFLRLVLRTSDGPDLIGERLALTGGVELEFEWETADAGGGSVRRSARARGDRAVIDFERAAPAAAARSFLPLEPRLLTLTQHVDFDFEGFHLAGATLVHRLLGADSDVPPPGWFLLKKGVDRVALDGSPLDAAWQVQLGTEQVLVRPPTRTNPEFELKFGSTSGRLEARAGG